MNEYIVETREELSSSTLRLRIIIDGFRNKDNVTIYKNNKVFGWRRENDLYPTFKLSQITDEFKNTLFEEVLELLKKDFTSLAYKDQRKCIKGSSKLLVKGNMIITKESDHPIVSQVIDKQYSSVIKVMEYLLLDADDICYGCVINDIEGEK